MGFNFTGITIDNNFDKKPKELIKFLGLPLTYVGEIDFESGSGYKEDDYFDIFFSDKGTAIYTNEPFQVNPALSKDCSILSYMVSETAMTFFMGYYQNGKVIREVSDQEGEISEIFGEQMDFEKDEHLMEAIIKQKDKMFGNSFYNMPMGKKGYRYKLVKSIKEDIYKAPFYDSSTIASNPGRLKLNFMQWTKMNCIPVLKKTIILLLSCLLMIKTHWLFGILFLASLLYNVWYWFTTYNTFKAGDVNPGKVVSVNPDLVAVATNMTKFVGDYPILRIIKTKLPKYEKEVGMFIPTVGLYNETPFDYPFWAEFHPVPFSHGTKDKGILKARFEEFSPEDFERIEKYLDELDTLDPGTYKVEKATSAWKDYPDVLIGNLSKMKGPDKDKENKES